MISVVAQTHLIALYRLSAAANAKEEAAYRALVKVRDNARIARDRVQSMAIDAEGVVLQ